MRTGKTKSEFPAVRIYVGVRGDECGVIIIDAMGIEKVFKGFIPFEKDVDVSVFALRESIKLARIRTKKVRFIIHTNSELLYSLFNRCANDNDTPNGKSIRIILAMIGNRHHSVVLNSKDKTSQIFLANAME